MLNPDGGGSDPNVPGRSRASASPPRDRRCTAAHDNAKARRRTEHTSAHPSVQHDHKTVTLIEPCAEVLIGDGHQGIRSSSPKGQRPSASAVRAKDAETVRERATLSPATASFAYATTAAASQYATQTYLARRAPTCPTEREPRCRRCSRSKGRESRHNRRLAEQRARAVQGDAGFSGSNALRREERRRAPDDGLGERGGAFQPALTRATASNQRSCCQRRPATRRYHREPDVPRGRARCVPRRSCNEHQQSATTSAGGKPPVTLTIEPGSRCGWQEERCIRNRRGTDHRGRARFALIATSTPPSRDRVHLERGHTRCGAGSGDVPTTTGQNRSGTHLAGGTSVTGPCPDNSEADDDAAIRRFGVPTSQFVTNTRSSRARTTASIAAGNGFLRSSSSCPRTRSALGVQETLHRTPRTSARRRHIPLVRESQRAGVVHFVNHDAVRTEARSSSFGARAHASRPRWIASSSATSARGCLGPRAYAQARVGGELAREVDVRGPQNNQQRDRAFRSSRAEPRSNANSKAGVRIWKSSPFMQFQCATMPSSGAWGEDHA